MKNIIVVCADIEDQIMNLQELKDRKVFMLESGIKKTGLNNFNKNWL